ncbi:MAG: aminopeptidase [Gammaproteobacteria bacterium]|nr:aminopeptidase [Gammaproteobacteria bacterium]
MFSFITLDRGGSNSRIAPGFFLRRLWLLGVVLLLSGCSSVSYYYQSIHGHLTLMHDSKPIDLLLQDVDTDPGLRKKLRLVLEAREFASTHLGLPANDSYHSFAALDRKAVVWSVVATPEFSVTPKQWCYPVIGCASYRGYFSRERAQRYAETLRQDGLDVAVEPAAAYSTLGWFDDPLPSTVINWPEPQLVGLIFHELAHQQLYIADDSAFNESFATAVEQVGVERWFRLRKDAAGVGRWQQRKGRKQEFNRLLLQARTRLQQLYVRPLQPVEMRRQKAVTFAALQNDYHRLKQRWGGYSGYDHWFGRELNNARLASVATYAQWVSAFLALLEESDGELARFYLASEQLAKTSPQQRRSRLHKLRQQ